jgi:hypothetical protein
MVGARPGEMHESQCQRRFDRVKLSSGEMSDPSSQMRGSASPLHHRSGGLGRSLDPGGGRGERDLSQKDLVKKPWKPQELAALVRAIVDQRQGG